MAADGGHILVAGSYGAACGAACSMGAISLPTPQFTGPAAAFIAQVDSSNGAVAGAKGYAMAQSTNSAAGLVRTHWDGGPDQGGSLLLLSYTSKLDLGPPVVGVLQATSTSNSASCLARIAHERAAKQGVANPTPGIHKYLTRYCHWQGIYHDNHPRQGLDNSEESMIRFPQRILTVRSRQLSSLVLTGAVVALALVDAVVVAAEDRRSPTPAWPSSTRRQTLAPLVLGRDGRCGGRGAWMRRWIELPSAERHRC